MPAKKKRNRWHWDYVHPFEDRHGRLRYRFRRKGVAVMLPDPAKDEAAFEAAYNEARFGQAAKPKSRAADKSVGAASLLYFASTEFKELKPNPQRTNRSRIKQVTDLYADLPLADFNHRNLKRLLDREAEQPGRRTGMLVAFRILFRVGIEEGWIAADPSAKIKKSKPGTGAPPWSWPQVVGFREHWPLGTRQRLALEVYLWTAQRSSDGHAMRACDVTAPLPFETDDGETLMLRRWRMAQEKTGEELEHVLHPDIAEAWDALEAAEGVGDYPLGAYGGRQPRTEKGGNNWFNDAAREALGTGTAPGGKNWTTHGLRKLGATIIAEAGGTDAEIGSRTGHRTRSEIVRYTRSAAQRKLSQSALAKVLRNVSAP